MGEIAVDEFARRVSQSMEAWPTVPHFIFVRTYQHWGSIERRFCRKLQLLDFIIQPRRNQFYFDLITPRGEITRLEVCSELHQKTIEYGRDAIMVCVWSSEFYNFDRDFRGTPGPEWRVK